MLFLGTAAAEGYPDPMCSCPSCKLALQSDDPKLKRRRAALLLDEENIVDFGPDVMHACVQYGQSLAKLKNVFLTHVHEDHFSLWNFGYAFMSVSDKSPMTLYLSKEARDGLIRIKKMIKKISPSLDLELAGGEKFYQMEALEPYREYDIDSMRVLTLRGRHQGYMPGESSLNYVIKSPQGTVLYACDTGRFYEESYEALQAYPLDIAIIEGTFGMMELGSDAGHLDRVSLCSVIDRLIKQGTITDSTQIYATHIAHKGGYTHYDYEAYLQQRYGSRAYVAYDGLDV